MSLLLATDVILVDETDVNWMLLLLYIHQLPFKCFIFYLLLQTKMSQDFLLA